METRLIDRFIKDPLLFFVFASYFVLFATFNNWLNNKSNSNADILAVSFIVSIIFSLWYLEWISRCRKTGIDPSQAEVKRKYATIAFCLLLPACVHQVISYDSAGSETPEEPASPTLPTSGADPTETPKVGNGGQMPGKAPSEPANGEAMDNLAVLTSQVADGPIKLARDLGALPQPSPTPTGELWALLGETASVELYGTDFRSSRPGGVPGINDVADLRDAATSGKSISVRGLMVRMCARGDSDIANCKATNFVADSGRLYQIQIEGKQVWGKVELIGK